MDENVLCPMAKQDEHKKKILSKIGGRMRELRKQKGYSNYEQFAFEHNIGRAQYGKDEKGQDLRMSTFFRVIDALGVSPSEFFAEGFDPDSSTKDNT